MEARMTDRMIRDAVAATFERTALGADLAVTVEGGIATLFGRTADAAQRFAAEAAACRTPGVRAVINRIEVGTGPDPDADVARAAADALAAIEDLAGNPICVSVADGVVALSGKAESWFDRDVAERLAWTLPGVHAVTNRIALPRGAAEPEAGDGTLG
jgi:osmotically-inducible protein OsmY